MSVDPAAEGIHTEFQLAESLDAEVAEGIAGRLARMDPWSTLGYGRGLLTAYLRDDKPDRLVYLIRSGGETVGLVVLRYPWLRGVYIELLAVFPEFQGGGLGRLAIRFIETRFSGLAPNLWLLVSSFNDAAQSFYRRNGFCPIGTIEDFVVAGKDEILMRKRI
jgi:ribosomal protein S18 acetylase RimI-like enzyme